MRLSDHDLLQLTEKELLELPEDVVRRLSIKLLIDLKEARERLKQSSRNSSRPPSSDKPCDKANTDKRDSSQQDDTQKSSQEESLDNDDCLEGTETEVDPKKNSKPAPEKRKVGKQPSATGYGRQQVLAITSVESHYPAVCSRCDNDLDPGSAIAHTAFETVDLHWADPKIPGLRLTNTKHTYYEIMCTCGHCTQQMPHRQMSHALTPHYLV